MKLKAEHYNSLRGELSSIYKVGTEAQAFVKGLDWPFGKFILEGKGETIWDSILAYADENSKIEELLKNVPSKYDDNKVLKSVRAAIRKKDAFIAEIDVRPYVNAAAAKVKLTLIYSNKGADQARVAEVREQFNVFEWGDDSVASEFFDIHNIPGGDDVNSTRLKNLGESGAVLAMITAGFFTNENMQLTFAARDMNKRIVPILVSECDWGRIRIFSERMPLPKDGKFIFSSNDKEHRMTEVTGGVREVIQLIGAQNVKVKKQ